jgi:chromosomal replication initiation ATPase DnaA
MTRGQQIVMDFPVVPSMAREDFLISDCNREALAWIDRAPDWQAPLLYIYGPEGAGKTHLAHIWQAQAGADAQVVEHFDALVGDRVREEELFHLYNRVRQVPGSVLLTGLKPLALYDFAVPDLASRLKSCPQVALGLPDEDLLRVVLVKLFSDRQMRIDTGVIAYCVARMERSFAAARDMVAQLDALALTQKKPVSVAMARGLLDFK